MTWFRVSLCGRPIPAGGDTLAQELLERLLKGPLRRPLRTCGGERRGPQWQCHECRALNDESRNKCSICGDPHNSSGKKNGKKDKDKRNNSKDNNHHKEEPTERSGVANGGGKGTGIVGSITGILPRQAQR
eukprot:11225934-Alexandrium_andersonii.AAC.1